MFSARLPFWGGGTSAAALEEDSSSSEERELKEEEHWIESGEFFPEDEAKTMRQFLLDAPRLDVTLDDQPWENKDEPKALLEYLFEVLPRHSALLAAEFCTQTVLAPFFCSVKDTLPQELHFVDGGRQAIKVYTDQMKMLLEKPFRVVEFNDNQDAKMLFMVTLIISVNLENGFVQHRFTRSALVEKDWVYVEDFSLEDEAAFDKGPGAEAVAASAERLRGHA